MVGGRVGFPCFSWFFGLIFGFFLGERGGERESDVG